MSSIGKVEVLFLIWALNSMDSQEVEDKTVEGIWQQYGWAYDQMEALAEQDRIAERLEVTEEV